MKSNEGYQNALFTMFGDTLESVDDKDKEGKEVESTVYGEEDDDGYEDDDEGEDDEGEEAENEEAEEEKEEKAKKGKPDNKKKEDN